MLRRENRPGGGKGRSWDEYTEEAGSREAGDAQKTMGRVRMKLGANVSRELGVTMWNCLYLMP